MVKSLNSCCFVLRNVLTVGLFYTCKYAVAVFPQCCTSPIHACECGGFEDAALPNHDTVSCHQLTCLPVECSKQVFLEYSKTFPVFSGSCPNFFGMCYRHQIQNECIWTWVSCRCTFFMFYRASQLFLERRLYLDFIFTFLQGCLLQE